MSTRIIKRGEKQETSFKFSQTRRGEIYWVKLDPTFGKEINKTRPCVVISNDRQNEYSPLIIVVPITSDLEKVYPFEVMRERQSANWPSAKHW